MGATQGVNDKTFLRFNRWGLAENPVGRDVVWTDRGVERLARVVAVYRHEGYNSATMLRLRYFCGDDAPDVAASFIKVLRYPAEVLSAAKESQS